MKCLNVAAICCALACGVLGGAGSHVRADVRLNALLPTGGALATVPPGGTVLVSVSLASEMQVDFNAALFRLVFTREGCVINGYSWSAPFVTGGPTDFSLEGLTLPASIDNYTLEGAGYPIDTADAEFGVFDFVAVAHQGPLMDVLIRTPIDAAPGSTFYIVAYPDTFSNGFAMIDVGVGLILRVDIVKNGVLGDISGDGIVDGSDLGLLLGNWGNAGYGDLDGDGVVNGADLGTLLGEWSIPPTT